MTEILEKTTFSRRTFLKGGAMVVGFSAFGVTRVAGAKAGAFDGPNDQYQVDSWITIHANNTASIKSGAIFQGTGSVTGILMIAAEELDMDMSQMLHVNDDTSVTPNTGPKEASNTIINAGPGVRAAAATARQALLQIASVRLAVPVTQLSVSKGIISGGGKTVGYGDVLGGKLFNVRMPATYKMDTTNLGPFGFVGGLQPGQAPAKAVKDYKIVGTRVPRVDIPGIVTGKSVYIQNVRVPGMLHGRIVRPRGQMLYNFGAPVISVDESSIAHIPGARVVRKKDFIGVVAPHEYSAIQAAAQLKVKWADPPQALPGAGNEFKHMRELDSAGKTAESVRTSAGDVDKGMASAAHVVQGTYGWPTNSHTPMGPCCAIADVSPAGVRILSGTQGVYKTQDSVARVLGLPASQVRVTAFAMGGCFGNGMQYRDAAMAAALMSKAVGKPVRVQWMRWDEIGWDSTAPGTLMDIRAGADAKGNLVAFDFVQFYPQYDTEEVETVPALTGTPMVPTSIAGVYSPLPMYEVANNRHLLKSLPLADNWIKVDWMRGGSSPHATFAGEQAIDELAHQANMDPVAFRIQNVTKGSMKEPMLAVMDAVVKAANYRPRVTASNLSQERVVTGRGVAWSNADKPGVPTAAIADVTVDRKTGKVVAKHVYHAASAGLTVSLAGVENQSDGGVVQIASRVLIEELRFSKTHVTSTDFSSYPILRFKDAPNVTSIILQRPDVVPQGVGEPMAMTAAAAIANAVFDATGVRLRTAPLTPARVRAALAAAKA
jgi:CO/xanthine dehydrogenase Mo-binding subunit